MSFELLTEAHGNPKTKKGIAVGHATAALMLAHADTSVYMGGANLCPHASAGCAAECLGKQGRAAPSKGGIAERIKMARVFRTLRFLKDRDAFMEALVRDIHAHVRRSKAAGLKPSVRLNATSDVLWERVTTPYAKQTIFELFPKVQFFDYTAYSLLTSRKARPANYHLTFSRKETTPDRVVIDHVNAGFSVAVPFRVKRSGALPSSYLGVDVFDGDKTDLRFLDPKGVIVGLRAKGSAMQDSTGWVVGERRMS